MKGRKDFETGLNSTGHSPGFSLPFKCPAEHLNERGLHAGAPAYPQG
ncbi:MAG: hypothetical protein M3040_01100 [Bacteroidota bacterium]|nr:hypothetical protein [Bacteroidota bacterium]